MDFPALADCLGISMPDEATVALEGGDPLPVETQDSAKVDCPSMAAKWWLGFSNVHPCGLSRQFERMGLKAYNKAKKTGVLVIDFVTCEYDVHNQTCLAVHI